VAADLVSVEVTVACSLGQDGVAAKATPAQSARVVRTEAILRSDRIDDDNGSLLSTTYWRARRTIYICIRYANLLSR
jgi:hypothetical protein